MTGRPLSGVLPVLSVPFSADWEIDRGALAAEIDWLLALGCDGVVIGMVSEILRLDRRDREELAEIVVDATAGRGPVIVAASAESTRSACALARHAARIGADAVMTNAPLLSSAPPEALVAHFTAVAEAAGELPLVVQDASGYVGEPLPLDAMVRLLNAFDPVKVQFKPEAAPLGPRLSELIDATDGRARTFEGSGGLALVESHRRGAVGTMPGADIPWAIVAIWRALEGGDLERADLVAAHVSALLSHVTALDSYIAVEKHLLVAQGVIPHARRLGPALPLDPVTAQEVERLMERLRNAVDRAGDLASAGRRS